MNYEFIATIATLLLVGAGVIGFVLHDIKSISRKADASCEPGTPGRSTNSPGKRLP